MSAHVGVETSKDASVASPQIAGTLYELAYSWDDREDSVRVEVIAIR